jgi:hypothetical protein
LFVDYSIVYNKLNLDSSMLRKLVVISDTQRLMDEKVDSIPKMSQ